MGTLLPRPEWRVHSAEYDEGLRTALDAVRAARRALEHARIEKRVTADEYRRRLNFVQAAEEYIEAAQSGIIS